MDLNAGPALIFVDAITGETDVLGGFGGGGYTERTRKGLARIRRQQAKLRRLRLLSGGHALADGAGVALRDGRVWTQADHLRVLGARMISMPDRLRCAGAGAA